MTHLQMFEIALLLEHFFVVGQSRLKSVDGDAFIQVSKNAGMHHHCQKWKGREVAVFTIILSTGIGFLLDFVSRCQHLEL